MTDKEESPVSSRKRTFGAAPTQCSGAEYSAGTAFVEGSFVPVGEARIPMLDLGFLHSDATYDVVHVWKGRFFRLEDHLDRFEHSAVELRLDLPYSRDEIRAILCTCVRRSGLRDAYVEMICTRGVAPPGGRDPRQCRNAFFAFAIPFVWIVDPEGQKRGINLVVSSVVRIPPQSVDPTVKNYHWGDFTRGLFEAFDRGGDTAVLVDLEGNVSEGPGFNVFAVVRKTVVTPGRTVLKGITQRTIQELCAELAIPFRAAVVTPAELRQAEEVFLSSTAGGIMPATRVNGQFIGKGKPGPLTVQLRELYWRKHEQGWHGTAVNYD